MGKFCVIRYTNKVPKIRSNNNVDDNIIIIINYYKIVKEEIACHCFVTGSPSKGTPSTSCSSAKDTEKGKSNLPPDTALWTVTEVVSFFSSLGFPEEAKSFQNQVSIYSQLSADGHSRKQTALLTDAFSNPRFTSQSNSIVTYSHKWTLSRKWMRTLLKMKIGFFFCLCSLARKQTPPV